MKKISVTIELLDELLGTCSSDPKIHEDFIASKAPDAMSRDEYDDIHCPFDTVRACFVSHFY